MSVIKFPKLDFSFEDVQIFQTVDLASPNNGLLTHFGVDCTIP